MAWRRIALLRRAGGDVPGAPPRTEDARGRLVIFGGEVRDRYRVIGVHMTQGAPPPLASNSAAISGSITRCTSAALGVVQPYGFQRGVTIAWPRL